MTRILTHIRTNTVAYVALFVALGGTSYAAVSIPAGSVGTKQLRNGAITPVKLDGKYINGSVRAWAIVSPTGKILAGAGKPQDDSAVSLAQGDVFEIRWGVRLPAVCATIANVDGPLSPSTETAPIPGNPSAPQTAGYVVVLGSSSRPKAVSATQLETFNQVGTPSPLAFDVAVIC